MPTTKIHVNQHEIRKNRKDGTDLPVLTVKTYNTNQYAHEVIITDHNGNECARVWIETKLDVTTVTRD